MKGSTMFVFDLQRFAEDDMDQGQVGLPESGDQVSSDADAGPQQPDAGTDVQAGDGQQTSQPPRMFTQEDVNRIVEQRLRRVNRQWEQRYNELQQRLTQIQQPPAVVNRQELNRQFLTEFSKDPYGTLERFAERYFAEKTRQQAEAVSRAQEAARDAWQDMQFKYPDFAQHATAVMQHISADPFLSAVLRSVGNNVTPEIYAGVLEQAYHAVKGRTQQALNTAAGMQLAREQAAIAAAKQKAGVQRQAASSGLPQQKSPEDILFEAIRNA